MLLVVVVIVVLVVVVFMVDVIVGVGVVVDACKMGLVTFSPWCSSQCLWANACLSLFVHGLGFFGFARLLIVFVFVFACGRKKPS